MTHRHNNLSAVLFYADTCRGSWCSWTVFSTWLAGLRIVTGSGILRSITDLRAVSAKVFPQKRLSVHREVEP